MSAQSITSHPVYVQASNKAKYYNSQLDKELSRYPVLNDIEARMQVPKTVLALGGAVLCTFLVLINTLAAPTSNLVGWALPAYLSFRALETPGHEDDIQWLTYWVVFGFFNFIESFAIRVVLHYLPFYYAFKTVFVLWLQLPATRGARTFYHSVLSPLLAHSNNQKAHKYAPPETTATTYDLRSKVQTATATAPTEY
jgi:receptor expression-enhancing protein 5/6